MAKLTTTKSREPLVQQADKLYLENTLLRIAGALFCHDSKRAAAHTGQFEVNKGVTERHIVVRPDPQLGQPGPLAHRIFVALIKKHSDYGRPIQSDGAASPSDSLVRAIRESPEVGRGSPSIK